MKELEIAKEKLAEYDRKKLELYLKLKEDYLLNDIDEYSESFYDDVRKCFCEKIGDWSVMRDADYADVLDLLYRLLTYALESDANVEDYMYNRKLMDVLHIAKQAKKDCLKDMKKAEEVLEETEEIIKICEDLNA